MAHAPAFRTRPTGATAELGKSGYPLVTSETGGRIDIRTGVSEEGFNPVDLLYASLSACLAMSVRVAAAKLGLAARLEHVRVQVSGEKTDTEPYRIRRFDLAFILRGDLDEETRRAIVSHAKEICTVSNTLDPGAEIVSTISGASG